jgi:polyisoprenoid-binding protein YceI
VRLIVICLLTSAALPSFGQAQAPAFEITPVDSTIVFNVKASAAIVGKFDKWEASVAFTSLRCA